MWVGGAHSDYAVRNTVLALRAVQLGLLDRVRAVGTWLQWLLHLTLVRLSASTCKHA